VSGSALGIDVGTTSVKVVVMDADGRLVATASSHHGIEETAAGVQADPAAWWASLLTALGRLQVDLGSVGSVGFSGNMSSVVLVAEDLSVVRPAVLLADSRGQEQLDALDDDVVAAVVEQSGNIPETVFSLSTLLWLRAAEPASLAAAAAWLSAKDYLRARLTGVLATDPTDAWNSLLLREGDWATDLIEGLGLPRRTFPPVLPSDAVAGHVTAEAAAVTGLRPGTPVATGSGDVAAGIAGAGGLEPASLAVSLGTSVTVMAAVGALRLPPAALGRLTVHPTASGGLFALGSLLTGGLALNWIRTLAGAEAIARVGSEPQEGPGVTFLPYLAGTGSPDFVAAARGSLLGLSPSTTGVEITAALLEAVAFDVADLVDLLGAGGYTSVQVSGGGSNIPAWPQVLADVIGLPVDTLDAPDLSAIGAAVLAWRAVGRDVRAVSGGALVQPRDRFAGTWRRRRAQYALARHAVLDLYTTPPTPERETAT
jgi:xylulokinase